MGLLRAAFPDRAFGSIGSREGAMHVGGTVDMRGRCVADVCDALANAL